MGRQRRTPVVRRRLSGTDTAVRLVAAGGGFALVPSSVARAAAGPAHGTRVVALATPVAPVEAVVAWRQGERPSPVLTRFLRAALSTPEPDRLGPAHERETERGCSGDPTQPGDRQAVVVEQLGDPAGEVDEVRGGQVGVEVLRGLQFS